MDVTRFNDAIIDYARSEIMYNGTIASLTKMNFYFKNISGAG